jgi:CRP-like cAMP-binding protein
MVSHLPNEEYEMIEKVANMRAVSKGERLHLQGYADKKIQILERGAVKIVKQAPF